MRHGALAAGWVVATGLALAAPAVAEPRLTVLHEFSGGMDGNGTAIGLTSPTPTMIYGVSGASGSPGQCCGKVFRLTKTSVPGTDWPIETLYSFGPGPDGNRPAGTPPVVGSDGSLYGTARFGGPADGGVVWQLSPPPGGTGQWTYRVLYGFDRRHQARGVYPGSGLVMDAGGTLYGLAGGGANGNGVVFALAPPSAGATAWREDVLFDIPATTIAGGATIASGGVTLSTDQSDLYGTYGVNAPLGAGRAYVYRLHRGGSGWTPGVIYTAPTYGDFAQLRADPRGNLFGLFLQGGAGFSQSGAILQLSPPAGGTGEWVRQDLFTYDYRALVYGDIVLGAKGAVFGTIGLTYGEPPGEIFRLDPPASAGGAWTYVPVHTFLTPSLTAPSVPIGLVLGGGGNLLGATITGGRHGKGVIFRQEMYDRATP